VKFNNPKPKSSHGDGSFKAKDFKKLGECVILEGGVKVWNPERIVIGENVYIGHDTYLKAYLKNELTIGDHTWIGQGCYFHSAGGITIGKAVGIGPFVKILTSEHNDSGNLEIPVLFNELKFKPVVLKDGCDVGYGSIIMPGVTIGEGAIVGAGAVVTKDVPDFEVWAGVPAKFLRKR